MHESKGRAIALNNSEIRFNLPRGKVEKSNSRPRTGGIVPAPARLSNPPGPIPGGVGDDKDSSKGKVKGGGGDLFLLPLVSRRWFFHGIIRVGLFSSRRGGIPPTANKRRRKIIPEM